MTAMMIRTAGGPGLVNPIDFHERRTPRFSRATWIAVAIVSAGHVGLGAAIYYQRFEMPALPEEPPITTITMVKPKPLPAVTPMEPEPAQAPNTRFNPLPAPPTTTDVVAATPGETLTTSPTISVARPAPVSDEGAPAVRPAPPAPPAVINNPAWIRQPSADQLMRAYPDRALRAEVGGVAAMSCLVQPSGRVSDCRVVSETPGGYGFGRAAEGLSRYFQISPRTVDGAAVGSRVNISLRFNPPPAD